MLHRNLNVLSLVLLVTGCGGADFSAAPADQAAAGAGSAAEDAGPGTGGAAGTATGGVTGVTGGKGSVTGGAGPGGQPAGSGGDPGETGGTGTGGLQAGSGGAADAGGGRATGGAGTGTDAGPNGCSAPTTAQLTAALTAALPTTVAWPSFESAASTTTCSSGYAFAECGPQNGSITPTPNCGTIAIQWGSVSVLPSGDVYVSFTAHVNTPAKSGCSGAITNSCSISASTTAGTLKVHADTTIPTPFPYWLWGLTAVEPLGTWDATSTCPNFDPNVAAGSLDTVIAAAAQSSRVTAPLTCPKIP